MGFPRRPHTSVAHLQATISNSQDRRGVVEYVRGNVLIKLLDVDVRSVLRSCGTIRRVECNSTLGLGYKALQF